MAGREPEAWAVFTASRDDTFRLRCEAGDAGAERANPATPGVRSYPAAAKLAATTSQLTVLHHAAR